MAWRNDEIAANFFELAALYELRGGEGFRVRAYERAARALSGHGADLTTLSERELAAIPGVGKAVAGKVLEYLASGRIQTLERLRAEVPAGLRELVRVPGLGPRKARVLHETLGVGSVEELAAAVAAGRVAGLPGMGARTEANLARALQRLAGGLPGIPLGAALAVAEALRGQLAATPEVSRVEVAGSLRRMKATVHDLDLLAASADPAATGRAFAALPDVAEVLAAGDTRVSVRTRHGYQVDLRVVEPGVWGAALQYFTGSQAHNVRVRERAVKAGLKLSEYGLETRAGQPLAAETEEAVYRRLGLDWVPPVLREDRGEVEAAAAGTLPRLVALDDVAGDLHCHTELSPDSTAPLEVMVDAARRRGYRFLAVTDHAEKLLFGGASRQAMLDQRERLRALERRLGDLELLHGAELNIDRDGGLDYDDDFLDGFDVLVASVHDGLDQPGPELTRRLVRACEHPAVNVIGHPTGRLLGSRPGGDVDLEALCLAAART
ncbi:MAG TPA: helix-hairpin-helix domain-containing protein, partial [Actinomycetes bacterium]|nr:helix-hairpin-helix domain-containing protein [Actinomycetes bacterium]